MPLPPGLRTILVCLPVWCGLSLAIVRSDTTPETTAGHTLQSSIQMLHCASDQKQAAQHIKNIQLADSFVPGLPSETNTDQPQLQASTLDQALWILHKSAARYPKNKNLIERTVINWNFCGVIDNGKFYDHKIINGLSTRTPSQENIENNWRGFAAFGLIPTKNQEKFDFTTPYITTAINSLADIQLQRTYIAHCLPHPDDEHLYRANKRNFISRVISDKSTPTAFEPIRWDLECRDIPKLATKPKPINPPVLPVEPIVPLAKTPVKDIQPKETSISETEKIPALAAAAAPPVTSELEQVSHSLPPLEITNKEVTIKPDSGNSSTNEGVTVAIEMINERSDQPVQPTPVVVTGPSNGSAITSANANSLKGLSGSISIENRSFRSKDTSLKFSFAYKPIADSYWFIRSAVNVSQESKPLTYSWGIGYDDWHPGTWAIQLNHWGPLRPGDGLDAKNAVAEISHKLKNRWLKNNNLSSSLGLAKPLSAKPSLSWGWSWNPYSHWFIRSTLIKPLGTKGVNWSYGFGYTRYNDRSLSFEYNNWGINEFPKHNFRKNGQLSLIYRWAF